MELLVFPKVLTQYGSAIYDNAVVVVRGRVSVKEEEAAKLIADEIVLIDQYQPRHAGGSSYVAAQSAPAHGKTLYLKRILRDYRLQLYPVSD